MFIDDPFFQALLSPLSALEKLQVSYNVLYCNYAYATRLNTYCIHLYRFHFTTTNLYVLGFLQVPSFSPAVLELQVSCKVLKN